MTSVVLIAAAAVIAGARSYAAIGQWAKNAPQSALARVNVRVLPACGIRVPPSGATIRRVITLVCPGSLADLTGTDPADAESLAVDGKVARGSRHDDTPAAHLLAAMTDTGQVISQIRIPDKTNEITCFADLLGPFHLTDIVLTVDDLDFPHVVQVARVTRHSTRAKTGKWTRETVYVITSLTSRQASPERVARPVRSRWIIENRLHYVRDVTFGENASQVRTGRGPENTATLRSLAINLFRRAGFGNIAEAIRHMSYDIFSRPLDLLGIA